MSDVNEFFDDLIERLENIAPDKSEMFKKMIVILRFDWRGAQFYISPQPVTPSQFQKIRKKHTEFLINLAKENGISENLLRKKLYHSGRPLSKPLSPSIPANQIDLVN